MAAVEKILRETFRSADTMIEVAARAEIPDISLSKI